MHTSGDAALLAAWEAGRSQSPPARALSLLASTGVESATLANWPLGRRDSALLDLRAARFGPRITGLTHCPACGDRLELDFAVDDIRTACAGDDGGRQRGEGVRLAVAVDAHDGTGKERRLLRLCGDGQQVGRAQGAQRQAEAPFVRLDNARNLDETGTGLGLAIALDIARAHGGDLRLEDSPKGGLRAVVEIPV